MQMRVEGDGRYAAAEPISDLLMLRTARICRERRAAHQASAAGTVSAADASCSR